MTSGDGSPDLQLGCWDFSFFCLLYFFPYSLLSSYLLLLCLWLISSLMFPQGTGDELYIKVRFVRYIVHLLSSGSNDPQEDGPGYCSTVRIYLFCALFTSFHSFSSLLPLSFVSLSYLIVVVAMSESWAKLVHEFHFSYNHTEWKIIVLFSQKLQIIIICIIILIHHS